MIMLENILFKRIIVREIVFVLKCYDSYSSIN